MFQSKIVDTLINFSSVGIELNSHACLDSLTSELNIKIRLNTDFTELIKYLNLYYLLYLEDEIL